jgi:hypothetical protein
MTPAPKFWLGQLSATPGALEAMQESCQTPQVFLQRHVTGDWGELGAEDKQLNDDALREGSRILSAYRTLKGTKLWVITERGGVIVVDQWDCIDAIFHEAEP